jgi:hypothetical protein
VLRVKSPQDFGAGIVFALIGIAGVYFGKDLAMGTAARMGPGYFPTALSYVILAIGLIIAARGIALDGPPIERVQIRPLTLIIAALLLFGALIDQVGLALTSVALTVVAAYARRQPNLFEAVILGAGLALFTIGVFVYALNQPLPAWWGR